MVQMLHRQSLRVLPRLAGLARVTAERRETLTVHGTIGHRVHPLAAALAAGVQPADHVDLLVGVVTRRGYVAFVA